RADLERGAERVRPGTRAQVEHLVSRGERGEVEVIADTCKRGQRLGRDRVEQLARISDPQGELPTELEMKVSLLLTSHLPVHVLDLRLEHLAIDERGARGA